MASRHPLILSSMPRAHSGPTGPFVTQTPSTILAVRCDQPLPLPCWSLVQSPLDYKIRGKSEVVLPKKKKKKVACPHGEQLSPVSRENQPYPSLLLSSHLGFKPLKAPFLPPELLDPYWAM